MHPGWEFRTHSDYDETRSWIQNKALFDKTLEAAAADPERFKDFAYGSIPDIVRFEIIATLGGIYIDVDFEPLRPFDDLLDIGPFTGWESREFLCCALMGGPKGHPASQALVDALPVWAEKNWDKRAVDRTGPRFFTSVWSGRDDVTRFPPMMFFPVSWDEKDRLGGPYPPESYAVHHWNAGWLSEAERKRWGLDKGKTVILVPWRAGDEDREFAWRYVRRHLERLGWPIITADSPGEFNRSRAINRAADSDWDVAVIVDADTVDDLRAIRSAVKWCQQNEGAVVPWTSRLKLSREASRAFRGSAVTRDRDRNDRSKVSGVAAETRGGTIVVGRKTFDDLGGFDEGYEGWGYEDRDFRVRVIGHSSLRSLRATCFHLWHPLDHRVASEESKARFKALG